MAFASVLIHRISKLGRRFWLQFLFACLASFALERLAESVIESSKNGESALAQSVFDVGGLYQQLVTAGPRRLIPHCTTVVEIDPAQDPLAIRNTEVCRQRARIARLLQAVAAANPAVIVLDKFFDPASCRGDEAGKKETQELIRVIADVSARVPVIVGEDVHSPGWNLFPESSMLRFGIVNLDNDTRRAPLRWALGERYAELTAKTERGSTLAFQAAKQFDTRILEKNEQVRDLAERAENAYISFLKVDQFPHFYAGEILCQKPAGDIAGDCAELSKRNIDLTRFRPRDLGHQIVVIGERVPVGDNHNSVIGPVPGFYLQANYIEAILDERLFQPAYPVFNYLSGFLIFAAFELILVENHGRPGRAAFQVLLLLLGIVALLYLAVVHFGYYLNPATVGLLAILINLAHMLFAGLDRAKERQK